MNGNRIISLVILLLFARLGFANVLVTDIRLSPDTIGVNDSTMIRVDGSVKTVRPGQQNCTGLEIYFGDSNYQSSDPYKPPGTYVRFVPSSTASFPFYVSRQYTKIGGYYVYAQPISQYQGRWYVCQGSGRVATLEVLGDTIRSVRHITPAAVGQQTSVFVEGFGKCSQNVKLDWGDGSNSTIAGPVDLKAGGIASHVYGSTGTYTVTANGNVCDGTAQTTISVSLFAGLPGPIIDREAIEALRQRLNRLAEIPPLPARPMGSPPCPVCEGLMQQVAMLDQTGHILQKQANAILEILKTNQEKSRITGKNLHPASLVKELDEYFTLRQQLLKQIDQARIRAHDVKAPLKK